jgi:prohibitin 1
MTMSADTVNRDAASGLGRRDTWYGRLRQWWNRVSMEVTVGLIIFVMLLIFFAPRIFYNIPPGHVGVPWLRFFGGTVTDPGRIRSEGLRLMFPWDRLYIYDARLQRVEDNFEVLASDGLRINLDMTWRFRINIENSGILHKFVGPAYQAVILKPDIAARSRDAFSKNRPEEIYTERRFELQRQILEQVQFDLKHNFDPPGHKDVEFIVVEEILIRGIELPPGVQEAIVSKNVQFHQMEEYDFRIAKEQKEADRRRIEAFGIRQFQDIVSYGITDGYLRWRGIEATLELARSQNAKMVVIGAGQQGMPLILGNWESPVGGAARPEGTPPGAAALKPSISGEVVEPSGVPLKAPAGEGETGLTAQMPGAVAGPSPVIGPPNAPQSPIAGSGVTGGGVTTFLPPWLQNLPIIQLQRGAVQEALGAVPRPGPSPGGAAAAPYGPGS